MKRLIGALGLAAAGIALACVVPVPGGVVKVRRNDDGAAARAAAKAAAAAAAGAYLLPKLDAVLERLESRRGGLPPAESPEYSSAARRLVEEGAGEVVAVLGDPGLAAEAKATVDDLAPLRDYVRGAEEEALAALGRLQAAAPPPVRAVAAVDRGGSFDLRRAQRRDDDSDDGAVEGFLAALRKIRRRAAASDLQTRFCAVSKPGGGRFRIFPPSAPGRGQGVVAVTTLANVWRGRYVARVQLGGLTHEERNLDLVSPQEFTLECFRDAAGIGCRPHPRLLDACGAR